MDIPSIEYLIQSTQYNLNLSGNGGESSNVPAIIGYATAALGSAYLLYIGARSLWQRHNNPTIQLNSGDKSPIGMKRIN